MSSHYGVIHFFKKIEEDTLRNGKLRIPRSFVNECWEGIISNPVLLLLPNGAKWNLRCKKHDADVWLTNKWKKFAEFYSLDQDHLLVFKYVGKSQFHVIILDQTGLEIRYPLMEVTSDGEENGSNSLRQSKRAKPPLPFSRSTKKLKTNPRKEPKSFPRQDVETRGTQSRRTHVHQFDNGMPKIRGEEEIMHADRRPSKSKVIPIDKEQSAIERAKAFCSNTSIIIQMRKTYIQSNLIVPSRFIRKHQRKECDKVILRTSDNRTWDAKLCVNRCNGQLYLSTGWKDFVKDNNLEIGDVCIFEQMKSGGTISYTVLLFHGEEESSSPIIIPDAEIPRFNNQKLENDPKPNDESIPMDLICALGRDRGL
ncbi:B3 domain-containing transcription factor VRN1 [Cajanus cajan]|uniref:B3 domain-containing transcription factor VRN1 n=1 Tax=Cajanus cajan TaxID=3821 RepID=UPI00098DD406|nr:B3 domain-containing transcription factor VRN1 [Cajanus cajan]